MQVFRMFLVQLVLLAQQVLKETKVSQDQQVHKVVKAQSEQQDL